MVSGGLLAWFRMSMNYDSQPIFKPYEMQAAFHPDRSVRQVTHLTLSYIHYTIQGLFCIRCRMLSFSNIYAHNAWLLLFPSGLCCDWSLGSVPMVSSLSDPRNLYSLALYASLLALIVHTLRSKRY